MDSIHTWMERGKVNVKCCDRDYYTETPIGTLFRTAPSGVQCTNHYTSAPDALKNCFDACFSSSLVPFTLTAINQLQDMIPKWKLLTFYW